MARTKQTARKSLSRSASPEQRCRHFLRTRQHTRETLPNFLYRFYDEWEQVYSLGMTSAQALLLLVEILPEEWQGWAREKAETYVWASFTEVAEGYNLWEFCQLLGVRYRPSRAPPRGPYTPGIPTLTPLNRTLLGLDPNDYPGAPAGDHPRILLGLQPKELFMLESDEEEDLDGGNENFNAEEPEFLDEDEIFDEDLFLP
jgi:hypothetical protein